MEEKQTCYFNDGVRRIDFVLVYPMARTLQQQSEIKTYLTNLKSKGMQMEIEMGVRHQDLVFIKLHAPKTLLLEIANIHNVIMTFENDRTVPKYTRSLKLFKNILTKRPNPQNPFFTRCSNAARGVQATDISTAERILLVNYILARTDYGNAIGEYGISKLLNRQTFVSAYPLHDGKWQWSEEGQLTDRQLLARYWANAKSWYKMQPIHVIYNYYGPEVGFRFAWIGYYNQMLIYISIIGLVVFLYGVLTLELANQRRVSEICDSDLIMCPACMGEECSFKKLHTSCTFAKITFVFDNWTTLLFAVLITIWATCFVEFWKRREVNLLFKWNLMQANADIEILPEFEEKTPYRRISKNTGAIEAYVPLKIRVLHYGISCIVCLLMVFVVITSVIFVILMGTIVRTAFRKNGSHFLMRNMTLLSLTFTSILSVALIRIYSPQFARLVLKLTKMENQRTVLEYYNSFIIKNFILSFFNNYMPLFYLAMVKGKLYTNPGDYKQYSRFFGIQAEACHPSGCLSAVSMMLAFLVLMKKTTIKLITYGKPYIVQLFKMIINRPWKNIKSEVKETLPQWEEEYALRPVRDLYFVGIMMEHVLQYGIIIFFGPAFPLLPLLSLIGNAMEFRIIAFNLITKTRRPVPRRLRGLGAWNGIIAATTYFGVFCNAIILAFTTDFVSRKIYSGLGKSKGYIRSTLSEFAVKDYEEHVRNRLQKKNNITTCYYRGYRYGPDEEKKYQTNENYFYHLCVCFALVIIFEHVVLIITGLLAYAIPDVPFVIKEHLAYEDQKLKVYTQNV